MTIEGRGDFSSLLTSATPNDRYFPFLKFCLHKKIGRNSSKSHPACTVLRGPARPHTVDMTLPPEDIFPLEAVSMVYPPQVDARLDNRSLPGRMFCGVCQMIFTFNDGPGAHELGANHPGLTSLMYAAMTNDVEAARMLLQRGASVSLVNSYGRTPLILAAMAGYPSMVKLLLSVGSAVDVRDIWGRDAIMWAKRRGHTHVLPLLQHALQTRVNIQRQLVQASAATVGAELPHWSRSEFDPFGADADAAALAAEEAVRMARASLERASAEAEADRLAAVERQEMVKVAAEAARIHSAEDGRQKGGWMAMFSRRMGPRASSSTSESRPLDEKPVPPEGAYMLDPRAERVMTARRRAALSSRGKMLSGDVVSARSKASMLKNYKMGGYLTPKRRFDTQENKTAHLAALQQAGKPTSTGSGYKAGASSSNGHGHGHGYTNGHALPASPPTRAALQQPRSARLPRHQPDQGFLSRAEANLLAPPPSVTASLEASGLAMGGKQRMMDERYGPTDADELAAVSRRNSPDWDPGANAGALTDPSRFAGWTQHDVDAVHYHGSARLGSIDRSSRSFWDSARGSEGGGLVEGMSPEERLRMMRSQQRRVWINSSRRYIEKLKHREPPTPEERRRAQERLLSAKRKHAPRVYA